MSKRPRIKQADGSLLDLPLDAETLQGKGLNDLALKTDITDAIDNFNADEFEPKILELEQSIPTKVSQLENDSNFLTEHQDISGKADKSEIVNLTSNQEIEGIKSFLQRPLLPLNEVSPASTTINYCSLQMAPQEKNGVSIYQEGLKLYINGQATGYWTFDNLLSKTIPAGNIVFLVFEYDYEEGSADFGIRLRNDSTLSHAGSQNYIKVTAVDTIDRIQLYGSPGQDSSRIIVNKIELYDLTEIYGGNENVPTNFTIDTLNNISLNNRQAASVGDLSNYMPLTGGYVKGNIYMCEKSGASVGRGLMNWHYNSVRGDKQSGWGFDDDGEPCLSNAYGRRLLIATEGFTEDYLYYTFPEKSGTIALTSDLEGLGGGSSTRLEKTYTLSNIQGTEWVKLLKLNTSTNEFANGIVTINIYENLAAKTPSLVSSATVSLSYDCYAHKSDIAVLSCFPNNIKISGSGEFFEEGSAGGNSLTNLKFYYDDYLYLCGLLNYIPSDSLESLNVEVIVENNKNIELLESIGTVITDSDNQFLEGDTLKADKQYFIDLSYSLYNLKNSINRATIDNTTIMRFEMNGNCYFSFDYLGLDSSNVPIYDVINDSGNSIYSEGSYGTLANCHINQLDTILTSNEFYLCKTGGLTGGSGSNGVGLETYRTKHTFFLKNSLDTYETTGVRTLFECLDNAKLKLQIHAGSRNGKLYIDDKEVLDMSTCTGSEFLFDIPNKDSYITIEPTNGFEYMMFFSLSVILDMENVGNTKLIHRISIAPTSDIYIDNYELKFFAKYDSEDLTTPLYGGYMQISCYQTASKNGTPAVSKSYHLVSISEMLDMIQNLTKDNFPEIIDLSV